LRTASDAALARLETDGLQLAAAAGKALVRQPELNSYLAEAPAGATNSTLAQLMAAPLATGLPGLKPVSVSLYNGAGQRLMVARQPETIKAACWETATRNSRSAPSG
jgi:hypothetical protein